MPMPYRIELIDGHRAEVTRDRAPPDWPKGVPWKRPAEREYVVNKVQVKVYPDGRKAEATEEEIAVAQHVAELEASHFALIQTACSEVGMRSDGAKPTPEYLLMRIGELMRLEREAIEAEEAKEKQQHDAARAKKGNR